MTDDSKTPLRDTGARYERDEAGETTYADYRRTGDRLYIDHVFSPPTLRGTGASACWMMSRRCFRRFEPTVFDLQRRLRVASCRSVVAGIRATSPK